MLLVLFVARLSMAFQFQSVAALSPFILDQYAVGLTDIGLLIGLYLAPGVVVAIPGGAIAARFGDKRIVGLSMGLMLIGGAMISHGTGWSVLLAGRLMAGVGGVIVNIVMTKLLVDWFAGREIATAMAIFVNSWPVGIALALLVLPALETQGDLSLAWFAAQGLIAIGLLLFVLIYRSPPGAEPAGIRLRMKKLPVLPLVLAGLVWALYNAALAMVFSFGPVLLIERGWSAPAAGSVTSTFMILLSLSLPLGGVLADRTGRRDTLIMISLVSYTVLLPMTLVLPSGMVAALFAGVGVLFGLGAGPIMTLPSHVLSAEARSFGMGVFFTIYYAVMMIAPTLAGAVSDRIDSAGAALMVGSLMLIACMGALGLFRRTAVPAG